VTNCNSDAVDYFGKNIETKATINMKVSYRKQIIFLLVTIISGQRQHSNCNVA